MPNHGYDKGARRERDIMHYLQDRGHKAVRSAGSHGEADVWAFVNNKLLFIQSKAMHQSRNARNKILEDMEGKGFHVYGLSYPVVLSAEWKEDLEEAIRRTQA